jgi:hypothetical protein
MGWKEAKTQEELPRYQRGVDYGRARPVLIRKGNQVVVVEPGRNVWDGRFNPWTYAPMEVTMTTAKGDEWGMGTELFKGRMTKAKMAEAAPRIAAHLGVKVKDLPPIDRRKTFVWED